jgi:dienelactone hydrolase
MSMRTPSADEAVDIHVAEGRIQADLRVPGRPAGLIVFAHGSGSSRLSARNRAVAEFLNLQGFGTLLLDLLTAQEEAVDVRTREYRFDIARLGHRVVTAVDWAANRRDLQRLPIGCFGASTGAAAALIGAAVRPDVIRAIVSRGGRPDLAGAALADVRAPTLLIVGGSDETVIELNRQALRQLSAPARLEIVPDATHLFEEPGAMEQVMELATAWFHKHLHG